MITEREAAKSEDRLSTACRATELLSPRDSRLLLDHGQTGKNRITSRLPTIRPECVGENATSTWRLVQLIGEPLGPNHEVYGR